jgi:hypothetical protein
VNQIDTVFLVREEVIRMKLLRGMAYGVAAVLSFSLVLMAPGTSAADKKVNAGEILLISDEIRGQSVEIERPDGGMPSNTAPPALPSGIERPDGGMPSNTAPPALPSGGGDAGSGVASTGDDGGDPVASSDHGGGAGDDGSSGFGDDTNPGQGGAHEQSGNTGTDNPNNSPGR